MATREEIIKNSPYKPKKRRVMGYSRETKDSFNIRLDWRLKNEPGQFVFCTIPGIGEAPISICSYADDHVELNVREVGNLTKALSKVRKGDELLVRGAYGRPYPMKEFEGKNIIIIGGGVGVAPLKGVIEYIEKKRKRFNEVSLFFGFRTPEDTLFKKRIEKWSKEFKVYISYDRAGKRVPFGGKQGFVTQLIDENVQDNHGVAFICGPPIMIEKTAEILLKKGFSEQQIFISAERLMYCGIGKCGRCMIHGKYTCLDGAVFRYDELKEYKDD
jgi:anaerobic sulfite reductase subunit B